MVTTAPREGGVFTARQRNLARARLMRFTCRLSALGVFAAAMLSLPACDALSSLWEAGISGTVFLRTERGETLRQGGVEVRVVALGARKEIEAVEAEYHERVANRAKTVSALESERKALGEEQGRFERWADSEVEVLGLAAERGSMVGRFSGKDLEPAVGIKAKAVNRGSHKIASVFADLLCDGALITKPCLDCLRPLTVQAIFSARDSGDDKTLVIQPGASVAVEAHLVPPSLPLQQFGEILHCEHLQGRATTIFEPGGRQLPNPGATDLARKVSRLTRELAKIDSAGVSDLDGTVMATLQKHTKRATYTDVDGHYSFDRVPRGKWIVVALEETPGRGWFVDVQASGRFVEDLSNYNLSDPRLAARWREVVPAESRHDGTDAHPQMQRDEEAAKATAPHCFVFPTCSEREGRAPLRVEFSITGGCVDAIGEFEGELSWDFGDGSDRVHEPNPTHTYQAPGSYKAQVTVSDSPGKIEASGDLTIVVE